MDEGALGRIRGGSAADEMTVLAALREEIERLDPRARVEVSGAAGEEQLHVRHDNETRNTVSLHNLWNQLRGVSGEAAAGTIERFARLCLANFFSGEVEGAESIMPVVRDRGYMDSPREQAFDPACRELSTCGTLFVCLALDTPEYVRYLERSDLQELGFSGFEVAEEKALANLAFHARASGSLSVESRPILPEEARIGSSQARRDVIVHRLSLDGDYDASLVLLTGLASHLCADPESPLGHLSGPEAMAFALPSRDFLLIVDAREEHAAEALSLVAGSIHDNAAYAISPDVYGYARTDERVMLKPVGPQ
jgi:hypothetical protein